MTYNPVVSHPAAARRFLQLGHVPAWKRPLDICLAVLALFTLWPLMLSLVLAIRATSPGPALFVQERIGLGGRRFRMVKFRSMYVDADERLAALASDRDGLCFKMKSDPRITPLGRLLRRSSLDELPQLWNVLVGDMSMVGPRPALPSEVADYPPHAMERLAALPGLTGPWQVAGRADVGFNEMVRLDLAYVRGATLWGDLAILWRTVLVVGSGRGAY